MADHKDGSLRRNLGVSRRDLLRRGAIAGGTLVWAAPVLRSLTTPAYAQGLSPFHSCCVGTQDSSPVCGGGTNVVKLCDHFDVTTCRATLTALGATFVRFETCTSCLGYTCISGCLGAPGVDTTCHELKSS